MLDYILTIFRQMNITDIIDILIVAFVLYKLYSIMTQTRAIQLLKGIGILIVIWLLSDFAGLSVVNSVLDYVVLNAPLVSVILFQPEIRRALEHIGRNSFISSSFLASSRVQDDQIIKEILQALKKLSDAKVGALLVIEGQTGLKDIIETGTMIDASIKAPLIENIFVPKAPLHDGATILREDRIIAAGCLLPLSNNRSVSRDLGTRHRAALGMSANSDALILVVSEETGVISLAKDNELERFLNLEQIRKKLEAFYADEETSIQRLLKGETHER